MAFEKFTKFGESFSPRISIRNNGQIGINKGAINRFGILDYSHLTIHFDKDNELIGVKLLNASEEGALPIVIRNDNLTLHAKSFLDCYGIDYSETRTFPVRWDEANSMIILDLKKPISKEMG